MLGGLAFVMAVASSWGTTSCVSVETSAVVSGYSWKSHPSDPDRQYLFRDGVQVGGYDSKADIFRWYDAAKDSWGEPSAPPWESAPKIPNFGVVTEKIRSSEPGGSYWLNGYRATASAVERMMEDRSLADDSGMLRVTAIGRKDVCDRVGSDLRTNSNLAAYRDKTLFQSYRSDSWAVEPWKLPRDQEFFLSIQLPPDSKGRGKELHAQDYYSGPEQLAMALGEAVRKADPNYDPKKTPDLTKPKPEPKSPDAPADDKNLMLLGGLILAVVILIAGKNK